jgi:hypothetical protein
MSLARLLPLVVFAGFVGYSMTITVFTPMFLQGHGRLIPGGLIAALFIKAFLVAMAGFVLVGAALLLVSPTPINRSAKTMS